MVPIPRILNTFYLILYYHWVKFGKKIYSILLTISLIECYKIYLELMETIVKIKIFSLNQLYKYNMFTKIMKTRFIVFSIDFTIIYDIIFLNVC